MIDEHKQSIYGKLAELGISEAEAQTLRQLYWSYPYLPYAAAYLAEIMGHPPGTWVQIKPTALSRNIQVATYEILTQCGMAERFTFNLGWGKYE